MSEFNIADLFELVADRVPQRTALICGDTRRSYLEVEQRANQLAHYLQSQGIGQGDHIGLYLYNCNEYLESMLACFKIRAIPININYRYVGEELDYVFRNADIVGCIHGGEFAGELLAVREQLPQLRVFVSVGPLSDTQLPAADYEQAMAGHSATRDFGPRSGDDLFILYTGGTTGMPKGVMWPHRALYFAGLGGNGALADSLTPEQVAAAVDPESYTTLAPLAPMMHGAAWWAATASLLAGRTTVLYSGRSFNADEIWAMVAREKVNIIAIVGDAMAIPLLDSLKANPETHDLSPLFVIGSGGAVFSDWVQAGLREFFPNLIITNTFGSSETGMQGSDNQQAGGGLGSIERNENTNVITPDHRFVTAGSDEQGFLARAGHTPVGYYGDAKKTAETFITIDGRLWTLTGDFASVSSDGHIVVHGRGNNCINTGGEKVFPEEVEQAVKLHPAVQDALVVGVPDERFGSRVSAVVALRKNQALELESLIDHCRQHIAGYKVPRELHLVDTVSRSPSGKPDYTWAKRVASGDTPQS